MAKDKISIDDIGELINSDDILGKDVIDSEGKFIGIAESILIDPKKFDFVGISIDKGFLKKGLIIGKSYIKNVASNAVFLNIRPSYNIKGMKVFDMEGFQIGKVKEILLKENKNAIDKLIISSGILKKEIELSANFIKSIGYNILLNIKKKDLA